MYQPWEGCQRMTAGETEALGYKSSCDRGLGPRLRAWRSLWLQDLKEEA